jgi:hypothetical protein
MRFTRAARFGDLYIQFVFECRACGVSHIDAVEIDKVASGVAYQRLCLHPPSVPHQEHSTFGLSADTSTVRPSKTS